MKRDGRTRQRLTKLLEAALPEIRVEFLVEAKGFYRTNRNVDCFRWEGYGIRRDGGFRVTFHSYETMTNCVKRGIKVAKDETWSYDIYTLDPKHDSELIALRSVVKDLVTQLDDYAAVVTVPTKLSEALIRARPYAAVTP